MRQGGAFEQNTLAIAIFYGGTIDIIKKSLCEIGGGKEIFQSLLLLNSNGITAEIVGYPQSSDVHLALEKNLLPG